jgi:hypothetical protein
MCFSAPVSFIAGTVLLGIGAITTYRASHKREWAYALIPLLFGLQQLLEGALWLTFSDPTSHLNYGLTQAFSVFSQVLWPVYIPVAVLLLETVAWRKKAIALIALAGASVSLFLLYYLAHRTVVSQVQGNHIAYVFPHFHEFFATGLYLLGACVSPLLSSHRTVRWFGLAITASLVVTYVFYSTWFTSVWCFFSAAISALVLAHFPVHPHGEKSVPTGRTVR